MFGRGGQFDDLVKRQLDLFAADEADLLTETDAAEQAWNDAPREEAEEAYGDYQLAVDAIADRLLEIRDGYATTVDAAAADSYRSAFNRLAARRFRRHPTIASDLDA